MADDSVHHSRYSVQDLPAKFAAKVRIDPATGCWCWTGASFAGRGYGQFYAGNRKTVRAHRYCYEILEGPIPEDLVLDHLCRNEGCVNPAHLEPVTVRENIMRGVGLAAQNVEKTHCPQGHLYDGNNLRFTKSGARYCLACKRDKVIAYRKRLSPDQIEMERAKSREYERTRRKRPAIQTA